MPYCRECGSQLPDEHQAAEVAEAQTEQTEAVTDASVRIAEIQSARDIALARITAGLADAERDAELAHEQGRAEALESVLAPPEAAPEAPADSDPVVVVADATDEPEAAADELPPAEHEHQGDAVEDSKPERRAYGSATWFS